MFTSHYRGLRESLLDYCSKLVHKPLLLPFGSSDCSCVILSPPRPLFTFLHIAHFTTEHPSTSQSAEEPPMRHQPLQPLPYQQTVTT